MHILFTSFVLVALSEMGDKTQLLAFSLAAKYRRPWMVLSGILVATLLNHSIASTLGSWLFSQVNTRILSGVLAAVFIGFGFWTLKPDTISPDQSSNYNPFLTTLFLFFIAEMGDKTQLATVALGARYGAPVLVTIGTTLGMLVSDGLAVFLGEKLSNKIEMKWIRRLAASLFFIFGFASAYSAVFD